jgi:hypothetical protein
VQGRITLVVVAGAFAVAACSTSQTSTVAGGRCRYLTRSEAASLLATHRLERLLDRPEVSRPNCTYGVSNDLLMPTKIVSVSVGHDTPIDRSRTPTRCAAACPTPESVRLQGLGTGRWIEPRCPASAPDCNLFAISVGTLEFRAHNQVVHIAVGGMANNLTIARSAAQNVARRLA